MDAKIRQELREWLVTLHHDLNVTTNNCTSQALSGTSMATPGAAGLTALIRQYYTDGWYPTGTKISTNAITPSAALLKASLINSAVNMTGTTAIPANCQGWGRVLLENVLYFNGQTRKLWVKDNATAFNTGSTNEDRTYTFSVTAGEAFNGFLVGVAFALCVGGFAALRHRYEALHCLAGQAVEVEGERELGLVRQVEFTGTRDDTAVLINTWEPHSYAHQPGAPPVMRPRWRSRTRTPRSS